MREADGRYVRVPECSENGVSLSLSLSWRSLALPLSSSSIKNHEKKYNLSDHKWYCATALLILLVVIVLLLLLHFYLPAIAFVHPVDNNKNSSHRHHRCWIDDNR